MWTEITRQKSVEREAQRYASDLTDAEWALIEPHLPAAKHQGRPPRPSCAPYWTRFCISRGPGCQWRMLPKDFPPFTTVQGYFYDWPDDGFIKIINFHLLVQAREAASPRSEPSAGVIDSQSVKTTESGGPRGGACPRARQKPQPRGMRPRRSKSLPQRRLGAQAPYCDRYWRSAGWAEVHPADIQDRDGAVLVIEAIHQLFPWLRHLFADSVYNGPNLSDALAKFGNWTIEIVKRAADATGFKLLPRRWVVERTLAWLNRNRRLAKDFEASIASAKTWVYIASVQLLIRRLA